jgi:hypothetical protein
MGRRAALKILHPCMEEMNAVIKVPDGSLSTSISMERRDEFEVTSGLTIGSWNCVVLGFPFLVARHIVLRWSATTVTTEQLYNAVQFALDITGDATIMYPTFRAIGSIDVTMLGSATLTPAIQNSPVSSISSLVRSVRRSCLGTTTELNSSALTNEGRVVTGQWSPDISLSILPTSADPPLYYDTYRVEIPAILETEIVSSDQFCRQAEAKTGSYVPVRPISSGLDITPSQEWRLLSGIVAGATPATIETLTDHKDLYLRGWCVTSEHWSGLNPLASLRIKVREDLEVVASPDSIYSPFSTSGLPDDTRARSIVQEFSRTQPHGYPSDFNDLGSMLGNIIGGVGDAVKGLGIPILSDIAGTVSDVAKGPIGGLLGGLLGGLI